MSNKSTRDYDFNVTAGGTTVIDAPGSFYKVLTSTGDLKISRDGGASVRPMRAGRGERDIEFVRLFVTDISGAPNSGSILIGDTNFIDDTAYLASSINMRPEVYNISAAVSLAVGAVQILAPGANVAGVVIYELQASGQCTAGQGNGVFLAKAGAVPASATDGDMLGQVPVVAVSSSALSSGRVSGVQVPAGKGIYFWGNAGNAYVAGASYASLVGKAL